MVPWALQTPPDDIRPCALVLTACFSHSVSLNVTVSQLIVVTFGFKVVTKWYDLIFAYKPNLSKAMETPELNKIVTMYLPVRSGMWHFFMPRIFHSDLEDPPANEVWSYNESHTNNFIHGHDRADHTERLS